jgi:hypothetical protein
MEATLKLRMDQLDGEERGVTTPPFGVRAIMRLAFSSNLQKTSPLLIQHELLWCDDRHMKGRMLFPCMSHGANSTGRMLAARAGPLSVKTLIHQLYNYKCMNSNSGVSHLRHIHIPCL